MRRLTKLVALIRKNRAINRYSRQSEIRCQAISLMQYTAIDADQSLRIPWHEWVLTPLLPTGEWRLVELRYRNSEQLASIQRVSGAMYFGGIQPMARFAGEFPYFRQSR